MPIFLSLLVFAATMTAIYVVAILELPMWLLYVSVVLNVANVAVCAARVIRD